MPHVQLSQPLLALSFVAPLFPSQDELAPVVLLQRPGLPVADVVPPRPVVLPVADVVPPRPVVLAAAVLVAVVLAAVVLVVAAAHSFFAVVVAPVAPVEPAFVETVARNLAVVAAVDYGKNVQVA